MYSFCYKSMNGKKVNSRSVAVGRSVESGHHRDHRESAVVRIWLQRTTNTLLPDYTYYKWNVCTNKQFLSDHEENCFIMSTLTCGQIVREIQIAHPSWCHYVLVPPVPSQSSRVEIGGTTTLMSFGDRSKFFFGLEFVVEFNMSKRISSVLFWWPTDLPVTTVTPARLRP